MRSCAAMVPSMMLILSLAWAGSAWTQELPTGPVILEVSGATDPDDGGEVVRYDLAMLDRLEQGVIRTVTPWTEGLQTFEGPLGTALLSDAGVAGDVIHATALNDYSVTIPVADFEAYGVILATRREGAVMSVRDRGPIWIIYPWSDRPELKEDLFFGRSIWQLRSLEVLRN